MGELGRELTCGSPHRYQGMYEKADQMQPLVEALDRHDRMQVSME